MFGRKKDRELSTKSGAEVSARELSGEMPHQRTYPRPEPASAASRPALVEVPRRLPEVAGGAVRRPESRPAASAESDGKKLIVGREIVLTGEIRACERLVVEGRVEASLTDSRTIEIAQSGLFKGSAQIDTADISGRFEGDLVVRERLLLRSTGRIEGSVRYGEIEIERGGVICGEIEQLPEASRAAGAALPEAPARLVEPAPTERPAESQEGLFEATIGSGGGGA